jgi:hypothetical protein
VLNNPVSSGNPAQQAAAIRPNWEERPGGAAKAVRRVRIVFGRCVLDAFGDFTAASLNGNDRVGLAMNDRGPDIELFLRVLVKSVSETPTAVFAHRGVDLKRSETQDGVCIRGDNAAWNFIRRVQLSAIVASGRNIADGCDEDRDVRRGFQREAWLHDAVAGGS